MNLPRTPIRSNLPIADGVARPDLIPLAAFLVTHESRYDDAAIAAILDHVARNGELASCVALGDLNPDDEAEATEIYERSQPAVDWFAADWPNETIIDVEHTAAGDLYNAIVPEFEKRGYALTEIGEHDLTVRRDDLDIRIDIRYTCAAIERFSRQLNAMSSRGAN